MNTFISLPFLDCFSFVTIFWNYLQESVVYYNVYVDASVTSSMGDLWKILLSKNFSATLWPQCGTTAHWIRKFSVNIDVTAYTSCHYYQNKITNWKYKIIGELTDWVVLTQPLFPHSVKRLSRDTPSKARVTEPWGTFTTATNIYANVSYAVIRISVSYILYSQWC